MLVLNIQKLYDKNQNTTRKPTQLLRTHRNNKKRTLLNSKTTMVTQHTIQIQNQHRILHPRQTNSPIPLELHQQRTLNQHPTMVEQTPRKTKNHLTPNPMGKRRRRNHHRRMVQQKNPKPTPQTNTTTTHSVHDHDTPTFKH